jgi:RHS repeat-associated protein
LYNQGSGNKRFLTERIYDLGLNIDLTKLRAYDPATGRWWQVDPVAEISELSSEAPYSYSFNNPVRYNDPYGDCAKCKEFWNGVKEGFVNNYKAIGKVLSDPVAAVKEIKSDDVVGFAANHVTFGGYGIVKQNLELGKTILNGDAKGAGNIVGDGGANVTTAVVIGATAKAISGAIKISGNRPSGLGDLTKAEVRDIQKVVNQAERPIEVGGSAASGTRRGVGSDLPIGKGSGTRSDIDYIAPPSSMPYFDGLINKLPGLDPKSGIIPGTGNSFIGPFIRFEPNTSPTVISKTEIQ